MATTIEYALLAGASYFDTRTDKNRIPLPKTWSYISRVSQDTSAGFEASAFTNGTEIVISYAGTYDKDLTGGIAAGDGNDLIVGGGGDDYIWGDWDAWADPGAWTITETVEPGPNGGKTYLYTVNNLLVNEGHWTGDDAIYAGSGNDVVIAGKGNDLTYRDLVIGPQYTDSIFADGGTGRDILEGGGNVSQQFPLAA